MWPYWAIYWTLGNFLRTLAKFICLNLPHSLAFFVKVSKPIICLVKSFLGNFYIHLATFSGHTDPHYHHCGCYRVPNAHEPIIKVIGTLFSLPHVTGRASNSSLSKLSVTIATEFFLYNSIVIISFGYEMKWPVSGKETINNKTWQLR